MASLRHYLATCPLTQYKHAAIPRVVSRVKVVPLQAVKSEVQRRKGVLEDAGLPLTSSSGTLGPWSTSFQVSERNLNWNDELKVRLIKRVASQELQISDQEMEWRLEQLALLLPGLVDRLLRAPPLLVARAAVHTSTIATRLLALKQAFPSADLSVMVGNRLTLLLDDPMDDVVAASVRLRELLPGVNVDAFAADFPVVLDTDNFEMALEDCKRLLPDQDPVQLLRHSPHLVLNLVKGKNLIEYDQVSNPWA